MNQKYPIHRSKYGSSFLIIGKERRCIYCGELMWERKFEDEYGATHKDDYCKCDTAINEQDVIMALRKFEDERKAIHPSLKELMYENDLKKLNKEYGK